MAEERSRLGRGLAALIGEAQNEPGTTASARAQRKVPIEHLRANPRNPRSVYDEGDLEELTKSIRERGIIQPIVVRTLRGQNAYEIIAGERRWRAAQRANLHQVPIVILDVNDAEATQLAIIENVQRADLNPLEEAAGYQTLATEFKHSQDEIAKVVGKSRSHVANTLRLLKLPDSVKNYINAGKISAGHARALIGQDDPEGMAKQIVDKGLNVRQIEALRESKVKSRTKTAKRKKVIRDVNTAALEKELSDRLGLTVRIDQRGKGGSLKVTYKTLDQLDAVIRKLQR